MFLRSLHWVDLGKIKLSFFPCMCYFAFQDEYLYLGENPIKWTQLFKLFLVNFYFYQYDYECFLISHHLWVKWKLLSCVQLFATPWTIQSPGDLPNTGIKYRSPTLQADSFPAESQRKPLVTKISVKTSIQLNQIELF